MANTRIGKLAPRYSYAVNPHPEVRLSKCPLCEKATHPRKFALLIHVEGWGPFSLGKTCVYCAPCELIMVHQQELEGLLAQMFGNRIPKLSSKDYLVIGTVEKKVWQEGMKGSGLTVGQIWEHVADFKKVYDLQYDPGGWRR